MFDDLDPKEFEDTVRSVIAACAEVDGTAARASLLAEAGLLGLLAPEDVGGLGLPTRFAVSIASAAGAGLLAFPLIETLLLGRALSATDAPLAAALCSGEAIASIAWTGTAEDGVVGGAPLAKDASHLLIFRKDGAAVLAPLGEGVTVETGTAFDVDCPDATIRLGELPAAAELDAAAVRRLREDALVLRAAFILGSAQHCLAMACDYVQERVQFGKPLSANQVLRHRLSRDALAVETLRSALVRALAEPAEGSAMAREAVWLWAAQAGPSLAESAIQIFGGMGFTWEVPLHRHLRQMQAQSTRGGADQGLEALAASVIAGTESLWYKEIPDAV